MPPCLVSLNCSFRAESLLGSQPIHNSNSGFHRWVCAPLQTQIEAQCLEASGFLLPLLAYPVPFLLPLLTYPVPFWKSQRCNFTLGLQFPI